MSDRNEIIEALGRYARALEDRDGDAIATLFAPDGVFEVFSRYGREDYIKMGADVVGRDAIGAMVSKGSLPPGRGMHYLTTDHIVDFTGDEARLRAQFVVVESTANPRPADGWPSGASLMQGALGLVMVGNYDSQLRKVEGRWVFAHHQVKHSLPMAVPVTSS